MGSILSVPGHELNQLDIQLAKTIADTLEEHYPGWGWQVNINSEKSGGVINVLNGVLNDNPFVSKNYGYVLHISNISSHKATVKKAIMIGGELLERANMPRSRWQGQEPTTMDIN